MNFPKFLVLSSVALFAAIGILAVFKTPKSNTHSETKVAASPEIAVPVTLEREVKIVQSPAPISAPKAVAATATAPVKATVKNSPEVVAVAEPVIEKPLPEADIIYQLFNKGEPRLPFVETIVYKSRVPWLKGRPAWLSDYASYYATSRHFIARSLNGSCDYLKQEIAEGDPFNVFKKDKNIEFYMLVDISRCKMWFYAMDLDLNKRTLLKTYPVGLGRLNNERASGLLTPLGKYSLGSKVAIYRPKVEDYYNGQKTEMVRVFGSRWIPFENEISNCTSPAKGLGVHGVPWIANASGGLEEDCSSLGKYEGDGCIRLATKDIEEIFAIVLTKPTSIELVKNFSDAKLPGTE